MATSYKIRLRRFNGVDYDTLNLSSDSIIMSDGVSLENAFQSLFPSSDGIIKNDNGEFVIATKGTDYLTPDTAYSPIKSITATSYTINATDVGKTLAIESTNPTVSLSQQVSDVMPIGSEIAILVLMYTGTASITINLPSGYGRAAGAGRSFSVARLNGGYAMYAIKKLWSRGWVVTGPDVEVVS